MPRGDWDTTCLRDTMTREQIDAVLKSVRSWTEQHQEELAELAREIEARRKGIYVMTGEECEAIAQARLSDIASEAEAGAFFKDRGVA